ncbi:unnamed protein product [Lactuca virosa]|uniref:F-box domain-containing protein n=1 Tax=Lactuca virosa TaxID=75947 RepID=A0AAU9LXJ9_9ASTR|nr:unnamed protein product [Lactuca virosa]
MGHSSSDEAILHSCIKSSLLLDRSPIHCSSSPNYRMLDNLCEELMVEILTRLPPKSLLQFRSVSKSLHSCIDSPGFIRRHTSRSPQRLAFTHLVGHNYIKEYGDDVFCTLHAEDQLPLRGYIGITAVKFPHRNINIVGSCNGILCLLGCKDGVISLWNPSIMRQLTLPDCPRRCIYGLGIGFGFDPITDDNKIVSIPINGNGKGESSFVYALKTGAWRPIVSPMPLYSKSLSRSVYLNGVLHWVVGRCFPDSEQVEVGYIMTLDLRTHVFGMIALPKPCWETRRLATIQGSLAVITIVGDDSWVWVRRDADDSWSVVLESRANQVGFGVTKVLELSNSGDLLLDDVSDGFQVYNPKTGVRSLLVDFNDTSSLVNMNMYVESLHLLHMGTACEINHLFLQEKNKKKPNLVTSFKSISENDCLDYLFQYF